MITFENLNKIFIGLNEKEAIDKCSAQGLLFRIVSRDGTSFMKTCDYRPNRLNFEIKEGKVVNVLRG